MIIICYKVVIEMKLNRNKIRELLHQLARDAEFMEFFGKENYLYIGIINSKSVNHEEVIKFINEYGDLNFILLGIKNSQFANREITKFYNWEEIRKVRELEDKFITLEKDVEEIKKNLKENNKLLQFLKRRLLKRKRKRVKEPTDEKK